MATNIEQIFRSFVVSKFREIQEEQEQQQQHGGSGKVEGQQNGEPAPGPAEPAIPSDATASGTAGSHPSDQIVQKIEEVLSGALETEPQLKSDVDVDTAKSTSQSSKRGPTDEVEDEIPRKKSKKNKKHKSKKKKKKKKKKRKKEKKHKKQPKESKSSAQHGGHADLQPASHLKPEKMIAEHGDHAVSDHACHMQSEEVSSKISEEHGRHSGIGLVSHLLSDSQSLENLQSEKTNLTISDTCSAFNLQTGKLDHHEENASITTIKDCTKEEPAKVKQLSEPHESMYHIAVNMSENDVPLTVDAESGTSFTSRTRVASKSEIEKDLEAASTSGRIKALEDSKTILKSVSTGETKDSETTAESEATAQVKYLETTLKSVTVAGTHILETSLRSQSLGSDLVSVSKSVAEMEVLETSEGPMHATEVKHSEATTGSALVGNMKDSEAAVEPVIVAGTETFLESVTGADKESVHIGDMKNSGKVLGPVAVLKASEAALAATAVTEVKGSEASMASVHVGHRKDLVLKSMAIAHVLKAVQEPVSVMEVEGSESTQESLQIEELKDSAAAPELMRGAKNTETASESPTIVPEATQEIVPIEKVRGPEKYLKMKGESASVTILESSARPEAKDPQLIHEHMAMVEAKVLEAAPLSLKMKGVKVLETTLDTMATEKRVETIPVCLQMDDTRNLEAAAGTVAEVKSLEATSLSPQTKSVRDLEGKLGSAGLVKVLEGALEPVVVAVDSKVALEPVAVTKFPETTLQLEGAKDSERAELPQLSMQTEHTKASEVALGSVAVAKMKTLGAVVEFVALTKVKDSKETVKSEVTIESKDREKSNKRALISETSKVKSLQTVMESKAASAEVKLLEASRFEVMSEMKDFESVVEQVATAEATSSELSLQSQAVAELKASETPMEVQAMAEGKNLTSLPSKVMTEAKELEITPQTEAVVEDKNFEIAPKSVAAITDRRYLETTAEFETMPEVKELETVKDSEAVLESETITGMKVPKLLPITMVKALEARSESLPLADVQNLELGRVCDSMTVVTAAEPNIITEAKCLKPIPESLHTKSIRDSEAVPELLHTAVVKVAGSTVELEAGEVKNLEATSRYAIEKTKPVEIRDSETVLASETMMEVEVLETTSESSIRATLNNSETISMLNADQKKDFEMALKAEALVEMKDLEVAPEMLGTAEVKCLEEVPKSASVTQMITLPYVKDLGTVIGVEDFKTLPGHTADVKIPDPDQESKLMVEVKSLETVTIAEAKNLEATTDSLHTAHVTTLEAGQRPKVPPGVKVLDAALGPGPVLLAVAKLSEAASRPGPLVPAGVRVSEIASGPEQVVPAVAKISEAASRPVPVALTGARVLEAAPSSRPVMPAVASKPGPVMPAVTKVSEPVPRPGPAVLAVTRVSQAIPGPVVPAVAKVSQAAPGPGPSTPAVAKVSQAAPGPVAPAVAKVLQGAPGLGPAAPAVAKSCKVHQG
ncbi:PREDICTED: protein SON isoform X3 [Gavialis gangeticus]|uniref:protein SON isoform X2 n=1 Tax=Gavialis gangeticus TaxID=94835 RepID=UPI00092F85F6|nr:PREDICTED: protein SON isoform X2 [Gavialis gangeticus]XP_019379503.1 PREDICTED: protein SON isoform X3 [Gavialis gangeticus]